MGTTSYPGTRLMRHGYGVAPTASDKSGSRMLLHEPFNAFAFHHFAGKVSGPYYIIGFARPFAVHEPEDMTFMDDLNALFPFTRLYLAVCSIHF
jgi:hypothetical protein